jgi:hypothetical protein
MEKEEISRWRQLLTRGTKLTMITINLQYLAVPFWIYSAFMFVRGGYFCWTMKSGSDFLPALGIVVLIQNTFYSIVSLVIGLLVWFAFRSN